MDCSIGVAFKNFVILATDASAVSSIIVLKHNEEKVYKLSDHLMMAVSGEAGDTTQFAEFIAKNVQLYKMRNNYELSAASAAHYTRQNLAQSLRSRSPYAVNLLLAGYDKEAGGELFYMDYLATCAKVNYATHGYGGMFATSIMDRYYKADMTEEEAYNLVKLCVMDIQRRLLVNLARFHVHIVDKDGIRKLDPIVIEGGKLVLGRQGDEPMVLEGIVA